MSQQKASVTTPIQLQQARQRNGELAMQLRAAVAAGDDARINRLVAELLRCKGLSRSQRISMQQRALQSLVQSLRSAALSDDVTGLNNRRGFTQIGTRLLDVALRDGQPAHLVYFCVDQMDRVGDSLGGSAGQILIRDCGNLLRDLFPSYGVYEALGRMTHDEFAALTLREEFALRPEVIARVRDALHSHSPALDLSVGVAHADAETPLGIHELLTLGKRDAQMPAAGEALAVSQLGVHALAAYRV
jgi:diguanylate cyclase (GGDEF)-like protein